MSYAVRQRTREIGIRIALDADRGKVSRMVLSEVDRLVLFGGLIGLLSTFALSRLMSSLLYGVGASDPITFIIVPILLAMVASIAGLIPAQRAARIDPMIALRHD